MLKIQKEFFQTTSLTYFLHTFTKSHPLRKSCLVSREFRVLILNAACSVGHEDCIEKAGKWLKNFLQNVKHEPLPVDIRSIVYSYGETW